MGNHHITAEPARPHQAPPTRPVQRPAAITGWLLGVVAPAVFLVLETAGRYFP
jgi:hypothetical protein